MHSPRAPCVPLDPLARQISSMDLPFAESAMNLKWPQVLKTINEDPAGFFGDGGWNNILNIDSEVRWACPAIPAWQCRPTLTVTLLRQAGSIGEYSGRRRR